MIQNPLTTWWKARQWFRFPKIKFYFGKYTCGLPAYIHDKWIDVCITDLMWKDKWHTPRHEWDPQIGIRFFKKWQLMITFTNPVKGGCNMDYWEQLLWTVYYKHNDIVVAKNTWGWTDMDGKDTWNNDYLTEKAIHEIHNYAYRSKKLRKHKECSDNNNPY